MGDRFMIAARLHSPHLEDQLDIGLLYERDVVWVIIWFGILRKGEAIGLRLGDVRVFSGEQSPHIRLSLQKSKTDPYSRGCSVPLAFTSASGISIGDTVSHYVQRLGP